MADGYTVREINEIGQLAALRENWRALLRQTPDANFFQTLEWLEVYRRHRGDFQRLRSMVVERAGEVVGIVPMVVRPDITHMGTMKFLTYPLDFWGSFYGPIGRDTQGIMQAALRHVRETPRDWQVMELRWVDRDHSDAGHSETALSSAGYLSYTTQMDETSLIDFAGNTWEQYLADRGSKFRTNMRRWERLLGDVGKVGHVRYRPRGAAQGESDPRWDLYDACEEIARRSWQGSSTDGTTICSSEIRSYLRDVHEMAAREGLVDLNLLTIDDRPVAFTYNYILNQRLFGLRVGYDASVAKSGAGNILYLRIIEDSFRRGDILYDLGPGSLEAKKYIKTSSRRIYRLSHYPRWSVRAQLIAWHRRAEAKKLAASLVTAS